MVFMFEGLDVYRRSMQFVVDVYALNGRIKDKNITNQLRRAAMSIPLNIAEGQGRMHSREKRQFYNTARGSLLECVPILQICRSVGFLDDSKYRALYDLADNIGRMLTNLIKSVRPNDRESKVENRK